MAKPLKSTLSQAIYSAVKEAILAGRLESGQRIKVSELAAEHDVSLNVVREALNRLRGEQLVVSSPQIGFAVTKLSLDDFTDLVSLRIAIEGTALRWALEHGDMTWESQVVAAHHRLANTPGGPPILTQQWTQAHADFHLQILAGCRSPRMIEITRTLSDSAEIYRRWSLMAPDPDRDLAREHADLLDAVLARDVDRAITSLTNHLEQTRLTVQNRLTVNAATAR